MELFTRFEGVVDEEIILLGDFEFVCYTLSNGLKVFSHTRILNIIMADYTNRNLHNHLSELVPYLPFLFIQRKIRLSLVFIKDDRRIRAIAYEDFKVLCQAFVKADKDGQLSPKFFFAAILSGLFLKYDRMQEVEKSSRQQHF
ncbi:MAG: hypothetical protein ACXVAY_01855 [Mucilaginibacter sp.]